MFLEILAPWASGVSINGRRAVAPLSIGLVVGATKEMLTGFLRMLDNQVAVLALIAFSYAFLSAAEVIGHVITEFRFVGAHIEFQAVGMIVFQLQRIAAMRTKLFLTVMQRNLFFKFAVHDDRLVVISDFLYKSGRFRFRVEDEHPVLGTRQGHIEESTLLGVGITPIIEFHETQERVHLDLAGKSEYFVATVQDDDIVEPEPFGGMHRHVDQLDLRMMDGL